MSEEVGVRSEEFTSSVTVDAGERLREILREQDITEAEFARRLGVSRQAVFNQVKNRSFGVSVVRKYAEALGADFLELFDYLNDFDHTGAFVSGDHVFHELR